MHQHIFTLIALIAALSGCESIEAECYSLAPEGTWTVIDAPVSESSGNLKGRRDTRTVWFKSDDNQIGKCSPCGSGYRGRAYTFEYGVLGEFDKVVIRSCGGG